MDASQPWLAFSLSHCPPHLLQALHGDLSISVGGDHEGGHGASCVDLMVAEAPKLEDFLGGASGDHPLGGGYDSDLRSIAAGFRRASAAEQQPEADTKTAKAAETFGQRTSIFRGVTRHRWTGRYEAHLWDNSCRREGQSRKGRQVYLGGYDKEEKAARAYDLAALKYLGSNTSTNFPVSDYEKELEEMKKMTRQEFIALLRRRSSGFSRGASMYRGVTRHHQHGRWQARIGRVAGNKDLYLGTFGTQEEAAEAYDIAAIKFRGLGAVTNFDMSRYDVDSILNSDLPVGGACSKAASSRASDSPLPPPPPSASSSALAPAPAPALAGVSTQSFSSTLMAQQQELFSPLLALDQEQQQQWIDDHRRHHQHHPIFESFKSGSTVDFAAAGSDVVGELDLGKGGETSSLSSSTMPQEHGPTATATATQFYYFYNQETKHGLAAFRGALYGTE